MLSPQRIKTKLKIVDPRKWLEDRLRESTFGYSWRVGGDNKSPTHSPGYCLSIANESETDNRCVGAKELRHCEFFFTKLSPVVSVDSLSTVMSLKDSASSSSFHTPLLLQFFGYSIFILSSSYMCVYVQLIIINGICVLELFNLDRFLLSFAERRFSAKGYV